MRFPPFLSFFGIIAICASFDNDDAQTPLLQHSDNRNVSVALFEELEELSRVVDIAYCVSSTSLGILKPFKCLSRCHQFPAFELVTTWNTGPLLSDSCGYIALDHGKQRIVVAFRGTYSVTNTVIDLSTVPQAYVPYPGDDEEGGSVLETIAEEVQWEDVPGVGGFVKREAIVERTKSKCQNCTVHMGFHTAWLHTRKRILQDLEMQMLMYSDYQLNLVGHSLGGAVAALAALDLQARGYKPIVTTFGEPRIGNPELVQFLDRAFDLTDKTESPDDDTQMRYRRITHVDDPVPLLPLTEWGYAMHAGEIFISKYELSPDIADLQHCHGDNDKDCIASQDSTIPSEAEGIAKRKRDLIESMQDEIHDVVHEPWGIPSRYKLWQLFFAHRDYFWRLGLCMPGSDPLNKGQDGWDQDILAEDG